MAEGKSVWLELIGLRKKGDGKAPEILRPTREVFEFIVKNWDALCGDGYSDPYLHWNKTSPKLKDKYPNLPDWSISIPADKFDFGDEADAIKDRVKARRKAEAKAWKESQDGGGSRSGSDDDDDLPF